MSAKLTKKYVSSFITDEEISSYQPKITQAHNALHGKTGAGNAFTGWVDLPVDYDKDEFARIKKAAEKIRNNSDVLIVIGIGGSYLGARAAIEFVKGQNYNDTRKGTPAIYYAGNSISSSYLDEIISVCDGKDFSVNVISKSGTTTEPAVAFRIFREMLIEKYGKEKAAERIFVTTDKEKGTLKSFADKEGYETFVVPDDVGGRYSVLTAVGLLPIAAAGIDIDALMAGAAEARSALMSTSVEENDCYKYVAVRNALYNQGKKTEMFVSYEPCFTMMNEWLKQLFGESEGKEGKGLFPTSAIFSTDLHSLGQYIQEGERIMFETVIHFEKPRKEIFIKEDAENVDGLNFLAGKTMDFVNKQAYRGTVLAHNDGLVPNVIIKNDDMSEKSLGYLIYFFEKACAISGYVLGINPFDQPGVESYKKNMFALLGKPGYEKEKEILEQRLSK
ncbi:MAG: glucose-6-phosphate isomerase [Clostridia bacterium]|nr:glucose-6-phosphate isomerase [Clostridia bacterium]